MIRALSRRAGALLLVLGACAESPTGPVDASESAGTDDRADPADPGTASLAEDERGSVGVPPPPIAYCGRLGYTAAPDRCVFPDGTSCPGWDFYRASCGQERSYCNLHGGSVASKEMDMGGWTALVAVCTLDGAECTEASFVATGRCAGSAGSATEATLPPSSPSAAGCYAALGACDPTRASTCGPGRACDVDGILHAFACFDPPNDAGAGAACDNRAGPFCAPGLACSAGTCASYCCTDADCGVSGRCTETGQSGAIRKRVCR